MINLRKIKRFIRSNHDSNYEINKKVGMAEFIRIEALVGQHVRLACPNSMIVSVLMDRNKGLL